MRIRRNVGKAGITTAAALGMVLTSVGVGWAITPANIETPAVTAQVRQITEPTESVEDIEVPAGDDAVEVQDPSYAASITAPQDEGLTEADEAKSLESLATVTPDQARDAALAVVPGTAGKVELDNENGAVVYSVEITDGSGSDIDVKVDAGNGTVVHQDGDDGDHEG